MKQKNIYHLFSLIAVCCALFLSSCLEQINLDIPRENQDNLAVQGKILKGNPSTIRVGILKIFDFTASQRFIDVKTVKVIDEAGVELEIPKSGEGNYYIEIPEGDPNFEINFGKSYKLSVLTFAGQLIESTYEPLLPVPQPENLTATLITENIELIEGEVTPFDRIQFALNTPLQVPGEAEKSRLLWEFVETYEITDSPMEFGVDPKTCYISKMVGINDIQVLNANEVNADRLENYNFFKRNVIYTMAQGYYMTVYQKSLSKTAYEYWDHVAQSLIRTGNMFESPVGKIRSNMVNVNNLDEEIFGFFYATAQDTVRVYVSPELAGSPNIHCPPNVPPPPGGGCPVLVCCDCLDEEGSSLVKPEWW